MSGVFFHPPEYCSIINDIQPYSFIYSFAVDFYRAQGYLTQFRTHHGLNSGLARVRLFLARSSLKAPALRTHEQRFDGER
jgi:hypothetical protein